MSKAFISDRLPAYFQPVADMCLGIVENNHFSVRIKYRKKGSKEFIKIKYMESSCSIICIKEKAQTWTDVILKEETPYGLKETSFVFFIPTQMDNFKAFLKSHVLPVTFA